ncbi:MAG: peptidoglycan editing factor PgeF [Thermodesulfovibrionia bacterium]|nr:peptidoglycan editing factor PgeF [Thermodesulfovibrionia bacterium]
MKNFILPSNIALPEVMAFFSTKTASDISIEKLLLEELCIEADIYIPIQKHTDKVHVLKSGMERVIADAVITSRKNVLIGIKVADCVPILLCDKKIGVIGAVHAGWRGTASGILKRSIETMQREFNSLPENIMAAIGPSIKGCSYEVDDNVMKAVRSASGDGGYIKEAGEKYFIDLAHANRLQAVSSGVPEQNIWLSDECTFCNAEKFHSYRHSGENAGRQGGFIMMW